MKVYDKIEKLGAEINSNSNLDRIGLIAEHRKFGTFYIEVVGKTKNLPELAIYSALGQLITKMEEKKAFLNSGIAAPDTIEWKKAFIKTPNFVRHRLNLSLYFVSEEGIDRID